MSTLIDVADMPGYAESALNRGAVERVTGQTTADGRLVNAKVRRVDADAEARAHSVARGKVFYGRRPGQAGLDTVSCAEHGATLCVAKNEAGKLWRCPTCNEGAFEPAESHS